ncbi:MAG: ABC transporter permease subunit, partial [Actinobacteria bacterium]|nr:ABC transporter permease subunit [Actinomycetota bacterium]
LAYAFAFLFLPAGDVLVGAFNGEKGGWTFSNISGLFHQPYLGAFQNSIELSAVTAAIGGLGGLLLAYAAIREGTPRWIRSMLTTFSGVAANFGGIPLAFAFIATLGAIGIVTQFFRNQLHWDLYQHGFNLFTKTGVEIVYLYFQLPLMVLVISPAIDGLRREWREAAANLGARPLQFWRYVGIPVLMPSLLGAFILLFGNAFAAYATAYSLGYQNVIPVIIGAYINGNVLANPHFAQAMALGMFVILGVMMALYVPLQRRAARWVK